MFGGNVFIFKTIGFLVGKVNNALDARGDKNLAGAAAKNVGFGACAQLGVEPLGQCLGADAQFFQNLGNDAAWLFDQRQQNMLGIDLIVTVALDDLCSTLGGFLCSFGKSVKSHHRESSFSNYQT